MKIIITGAPGTGKTTIIKRLSESISLKKGFYTEEVRERGARVGFDVITFDGKRWPLSRMGPKAPRVGRYHVFVQEFEDGLKSLFENDINPYFFYLIDEVGGMELLSKKFTSFIRLLFESKCNIIATSGKIKNEVVVHVKRKSDCVLEVSRSNRNQMFEQIQSLVREQMKRDGYD